MAQTGQFPLLWCDQCLCYPLSTLMKPPLKPALYTFNWIGGGFNQVYARTKPEALREIAARFEGCRLSPDLTTLKRLTGKRIAAYWAAMPSIG